MPHKSQSQCTGRMHPQSTNQQETKDLLPHPRPAGSHLQSAQIPTLTAPQQRRGSKMENQDAQRGGETTSLPTAPGPNHSGVVALKAPKIRRQIGKNQKKGDCSLIFGSRRNRSHHLKKKKRRRPGVPLQRSACNAPEPPAGVLASHAPPPAKARSCAPHSV